MQFHRKLVSLLLFLSFLAPGALPSIFPQATPSVSQSSVAQKIHISGVSNAGKINASLYRGGQPNQEGLQQLKKLGIDTIVDLRGERRSVREKESKGAEALGIDFVNIPGNGWSPPGDEQVAQFFSLVGQSKKRVFIHCWFGSDRTGVFIAVYRIAFEDWTPDQALAEMHDFHFKGFWHPAMTAYVRDFPARLARSAELAPFRKVKKK
jgi:tyrosine-protein phosphatase SIW14